MPVLEAEPLVAKYRRRYTPSGAEGMPAHVTLLVPFTHATELDEERIAEVARTLAAFTPIDLAFERCAYFDDEPVLYLEPSPGEPFRQMTQALVRSFPEHLPYGGAHPEPTPHLTVATRLPRGELEQIAHDLDPALPLRARADEAWLVERREEGWRPRARFGFGGV